MRRLSLLLAACLALVAGCDSAAPDPVRVAEVVLADPASGEVWAYTHGSHWHGLVRLRAGEALLLDAFVVFADAADAGHDEPPRATWQRLSVHAGHAFHVTSDAADVATWHVEGDRLRVEARASGRAYTRLAVRRGAREIYRTPPLDTVADPAPLAGGTPAH